MKHYNGTPPRELMEEQSRWLAPARSRLLRLAGVAHRRCILDLGAGYGIVADELKRRGRGIVVAVDISFDARRDDFRMESESLCVSADAHLLPFPDSSFDLIFSQCALMWMNITQVVEEVNRILGHKGIVVAMEPDYGGMIEHPPEIATRDIWISALSRAGADPFAGRKLSAALHNAGLQVITDLTSRLFPPSSRRFDLLRTLPLSNDEIEKLSLIQKEDQNLSHVTYKIAHLPFFLIRAEKA